jgi:hypothetical protein
MPEVTSAHDVTDLEAVATVGQETWNLDFYIQFMSARLQHGGPLCSSNHLNLEVDCKLQRPRTRPRTGPGIKPKPLIIHFTMAIRQQHSTASLPWP